MATAFPQTAFNEKCITPFAMYWRDTRQLWNESQAATVVCSVVLPSSTAHYFRLSIRLTTTGTSVWTSTVSASWQCWKHKHYFPHIRRTDNWTILACSNYSLQIWGIHVLQKFCFYNLADKQIHLGWLHFLISWGSQFLLPSSKSYTFPSLHLFLTKISVIPFKGGLLC